MKNKHLSSSRSRLALQKETLKVLHLSVRTNLRAGKQESDSCDTTINPDDPLAAPDTWECKSSGPTSICTNYC